MEIIRRHLRPDIVVISGDEMDDVDWSAVKVGCIYLDIWGRVWIEINNRGYYPKFYSPRSLELFFRQRRFYERLPHRILAACRSRPSADLVGGWQFVYDRKNNMIIPFNVGIVPWEFIKERGDPDRSPNVGEVRRGAFATLFGKVDEVAARLGAEFAYFPVLNIPDEKMRRHGCVRIESRGWRQRLFNFMLTFPFRNQRTYIKRYDQG